MDYDAISKGYNELYKEEQFKKLIIIEKYIKVKKNNKLLDIGCGTGISTDYFKCKTYGIDSSKEMLKQGKGNLIYGFAEKLPFKNNYFDLVISITAIHNFKNSEQAIKEILRVKKENAQVVITLLKKSKNYNKIKKLIYKYFKNIKEIDEEKDMIFIMN